MIDLENILKTIGKNTWQDLQFLPEKLQKELAKIPLEGEAGGGLSASKEQQQVKCTPYR